MAYFDFKATLGEKKKEGGGREKKPLPNSCIFIGYINNYYLLCYLPGLQVMN